MIVFYSLYAVHVLILRHILILCFLFNLQCYVASPPHMNYQWLQTRPARHISLIEKETVYPSDQALVFEFSSFF